MTKTNNDRRSTNPLAQVPAGEIRCAGVELEAKAALTANINMTASYTYTDAEYTKTLIEGNTPEQVPENTYGVVIGAITPSTKVRCQV